LKEDLNITINQIRYLCDFDKNKGLLENIKHFYFYESGITELWGSHVLLEGQDINCFFYTQSQTLNILPLIQDMLSPHHRKRFPGNSTTHLPT